MNETTTVERAPRAVQVPDMDALFQQGQALLAPRSARNNITDLREMFTEYRHGVIPRCLSPTPRISWHRAEES